MNYQQAKAAEAIFKHHLESRGAHNVEVSYRLMHILRGPTGQPAQDLRGVHEAIKARRGYHCGYDVIVEVSVAMPSVRLGDRLKVSYKVAGEELYLGGVVFERIFDVVRHKIEDLIYQESVKNATVKAADLL